MYHPNEPIAENSGPASDRPSNQPWQAVVVELLARAASLCVENGLDVDGFMKGAWSAYVDTCSGLREHLEELQLLAQIEELRKLGRLGEA